MGAEAGAESAGEAGRAWRRGGAEAGASRDAADGQLTVSLT
ncbi:hypothetical protein ACWGA9_36230 [Streptomyces sp. NPDC054950]